MACAACAAAAARAAEGARHGRRRGGRAAPYLDQNLDSGRARYRRHYRGHVLVPILVWHILILCERESLDRAQQLRRQRHGEGREQRRRVLRPPAWLPPPSRPTRLSRAPAAQNDNFAPYSRKTRRAA